MVRRSTHEGDIESKVKPSKKLASVIARGFRHEVTLSLYDRYERAKVIADLDVRIMEPKAWKRLRAKDEAGVYAEGGHKIEWSATELEGGMILAVKARSEGLNCQRDTIPEPERAVKMRRLRDLIFETLERHRDEFVGVSCEIGAEGQATFHVEVDAETHLFTADVDVTINEDDR